MECSGFPSVPKDPSGTSKPLPKSKASAKSKGKAKAKAKVKGGKPKTKKSIPEKKSVEKDVKGKGPKSESRKKHAETDYGKAKKEFAKTFLWSNYEIVIFKIQCFQVAEVV